MMHNQGIVRQGSVPPMGGRSSIPPQANGIMGGMGMGMGMQAPSSPAQLQNQGIIRQDSVPPLGGRSSMPPPANGMMSGMNMGMGLPPPSSPAQMANQGIVRQGSVPPMSGRTSIPSQANGLMSGMSMSMQAPSSPHPNNVGPQPMPMTPSISASSITSLPGNIPSTIGHQPESMSASAIGAGSAAMNGLTNGNAIHPSLSSDASTSSLNPLPSNLNPRTTKVTTVSLLTSETTIPALSPAEISQIKKWMATDRSYEDILGQMQTLMGDEVREALSVGIAAPQWWERGPPGSTTNNWNRWRRPREPFELRYPRSRREPMARSGRKHTRREGIRLPRRISPEKADRPELLVPIRIEFDVEHHRMRDTFVWNLNDPIITPEMFAQSLVEDYSLGSAYHSIIVKSIQDQLADFRTHSASFDHDEGNLSDEGGTVMKGGLEGNEATWWEMWRIKVEQSKLLVEDEEHGIHNKKRKGSRKSSQKKNQTLKAEDDEDAHMLADNEFDGEDDNDKIAMLNDADNDTFKALSVEEIPLDEKAMHEDLRILIKLDIIVASIKLEDQFEWDIDNPAASPEEFAEVYTQELGLGGEFKTAIAHSIREQVQTYQKSLFLVGHPSDGSAVQDEELKQSFLPSLTSATRPVNEAMMFTPVLNYLSDGELDRTEKERDKDLNKRRKRNTRGRRGIALPDREPIRTYRTPAIGFPELDAATLALAAAANAPTSRRAAAAAASLTIANMVASENGTAFMPQTLPTAPQPPINTLASKEKKPKGLFKPPAFPPSLLRPRAHVGAPTASTGADASITGVLNENDVGGSSMLPPNDKANKVLSAKRAKELEREAKEKEFVDGQHRNLINGVWHCSNCGCPETIAVGRRKGPLGDKSQCGTCGKYWHRHRRPRPVEYNPDPEYHARIRQRENEVAKTPASKKKGAAAALRAQSAANTATPAADISEPQTPARSITDLESLRRSLTPTFKDDDDRPISPVSTASSASEAPLAQKVKTNGSSQAKSTPTPAPPAPSVVVSTPKQAASTSVQHSAEASSAPVSASAPTPTSPPRTWPPQWLSAAKQSMQARYPHDRFEVILRKVSASSTPEWRIKCLDCPGKLYTPGPGETLGNYEVHLRNRQHRQRVNDRHAAANTESREQSST